MQTPNNLKRHRERKLQVFKRQEQSVLSSLTMIGELPHRIFVSFQHFVAALTIFSFSLFKKFISSHTLRKHTSTQFFFCRQAHIQTFKKQSIMQKPITTQTPETKVGSSSGSFTHLKLKVLHLEEILLHDKWAS